MSKNLSKKNAPGIFSPTSPLEFLGYAGISALMGSLANANPIALGVVPLIALLWWFSDRRRKQPAVEITSLSLTKNPPRTAKGLILTISFYSARSQALDPNFVSQKVQEILISPNPTEQDFTDINLWKSNLSPQINAIDHHVKENTLQEVWLLPTKESLDAAKLLEKFLVWKYSKRLKINCEAPVAEFDYANTFKVCDRIFKESSYKEDWMLADITGGTKVMSVALALACIPPKRQMQYVDNSSLKPTGLDIDPILRSETN